MTSNRKTPSADDRLSAAADAVLALQASELRALRKAAITMAEYVLPHPSWHTERLHKAAIAAAHEIAPLLSANGDANDEQ